MCAKFQRSDKIQDLSRLLKILKLRKTEYEIDQIDFMWYFILFNLLTRSLPLVGLSQAAQEVFFSPNEIKK